MKERILRSFILRKLAVAAQPGMQRDIENIAKNMRAQGASEAYICDTLDYIIEENQAACIAAAEEAARRICE